MYPLSLQPNVTGNFTVDKQAIETSKAIVTVDDTPMFPELAIMIHLRR